MPDWSLVECVFVSQVPQQLRIWARTHHNPDFILLISSTYDLRAAIHCNVTSRNHISILSSQFLDSQLLALADLSKVYDSRLDACQRSSSNAFLASRWKLNVKLIDLDASYLPPLMART